MKYALLIPMEGNDDNDPNPRDWQWSLGPGRAASLHLKDRYVFKTLDDAKKEAAIWWNTQFVLVEE